MAQAFRRLSTNDIRRLKQLEAENARLKKLVAERDLEIEVMNEVAAKKLVSAPACRQQVAYGSRLDAAAMPALQKMDLQRKAA